MSYISFRVLSRRVPDAMTMLRQCSRCIARVSPVPAAARVRGIARAAKIVIPAPDLDDEIKQKAKAIESVMEALNKKHGKKSVMYAKDWKQTGGVLKTGVLTLDIALGGGWPKGRLIEVFGPESSGKTTLCLTAIRETLKDPGASAVIIDAEHALDTRFCTKLGIDLRRLVVTKPDFGEEALEQIQMFINSKSVDLIVVDSVAALIPRTEVEADFGTPQMGSHARLMSSGLKKLVQAAEKADCTIIFTNQIRNKVGVIFGSPETTTGGKALLFYASVRVDLRKTKKLAGAKKGDDDVGVKVRAKVVKCKTAVPFREAEFDILWDRGVDEVGCIFDAGIKSGVIEARGSHYYVQNEKLGQGRETVIEVLKEDEEKLSKLKDLVHESITEESDQSVLLSSNPDEADFDEDGHLLTKGALESENDDESAS